jgi:gamma-glutamyltranspeptidase/glutathione hydrolase
MKKLTFIFILFLIAQLLFAQQYARSKNGMVVSADGYASQVGCGILKKGGNAIDAAVATGFALAVTYPQAGNIGGGGFILIRLNNGETFSVDFREKAPAKAFRDMYIDSNGEFDSEKSTIGYLAAGVPGSVAGLLLAQEKFGKLKLKDVLTPAIELAEKGFKLHYRLAGSIEATIPKFKKFPASMKVFTKNGALYKENELFKQPDLANTLKLILRYGKKGFYEGKVADLIVKDMEKNGGLITHEDLKNYEPVMRKPVYISYRDHEIITMDLPSSAGFTLPMLFNIMENFPVSEWGWNSSKTVHYCAEAMKFVYANRAEYGGDPDFVKTPIEQLTSKSFAKEIADKIAPDKAIPSKEISYSNFSDSEKTETTHYSVMDKDGNAVSVTTTINGVFGNYLVVDGAGFLLNNEMDDFSAKPGAPNMFGLIGNEANSIVPNKRMLSSMSPTIVVKNGKPFMVIGSPGGSTIITTVFQVVMNVIDHKMDIQKAVNAQRFHHQWLPDRLNYEIYGLSKDVIHILKNMGYTLNEQLKAPNSAEGIIFNAENGYFYGASDIRGYGVAKGY